MCGRFALTNPADVLAAFFRLWGTHSISKRFNIAPTQSAPVVVRDAEIEDRRNLLEMRWGLVPWWAKDLAIGNRLINARADTAPSTPAFRSAFKRRRCIVPASGFYEWQTLAGGPKGRGKQPYYISRADQAPLALAGLWEVWQNPETKMPVQSFTILTTEPNEFMAPIHDRMPVVLEPEAFDRWLDPQALPETLVGLLKPAAAGVLTKHPVSSRVNSPKIDEPDLVSPVAAAPISSESLFDADS